MPNPNTTAAEMDGERAWGLGVQYENCPYRGRERHEWQHAWRSCEVGYRAKISAEAEPRMTTMSADQTTEDMGMGIARVSKQITPKQASEMLAVKLANMYPTQCPIAPHHWALGGTYPPLVELGIIVPEKVRGLSGGGWRRPRLTQFGEFVLLCLSEKAMIATGAMNPFEAEEEADVA